MTSLRFDLPAGEAARRLARRQLTELAKDLDAAGNGRNVHAARRRVKFLRSHLRLIRPAIGEESFALADGCLRTAGRALAGLRHAEAHPAAIAKLGRQTKGAEQALAELTAALSGPREAADAASAVAQAKLAVERLRGEINAWRLTARSRKPFLRAMARTYARARRRLAKGLAHGDTAVLHAARKAVIHHLHHLEILVPERETATSRRRAALDRLREALGDFNDLAELRRWIESPERPPALVHGKDALAAIAQRSGKLLARAKRLQAKLFGAKRKRFARKIGPLTGNSDRMAA